jgi:parvulin-like peptidyl-prolyl isomerase
MLASRPAVSNDHDVVVARVGDVMITAPELRRYLLYTVPNASLFASHAQRLSYLHRLIEDELMFQEAIRLKLHEDAAVATELKALEGKAVARYAYDKQVLQNAIPDSLVRELYDKMGRQRRLRHLFLACEQAGEASEVSIRINRLRERVMRGEDFSQLAKQVSEDSLTSENGGDLGYVRWGHRGFGNHFYEVAFALDYGKISQPVRSERGYHLLLAEGERTVAKPAFNDIKDALRRELIPLRSAEIASCQMQFRDNVLRDNRIFIHDSTLSKLYSKIIELNFTHAVHPADRLAGTLNEALTEDVWTSALLSSPDTSVTVVEFLSVDGREIAFGADLLLSYQRLRNYLIDKTDHEMLVLKWGYEQGYALENTVQAYLQEVKRTILIRDIETMMAGDSFVEPDEEEYQAYYTLYMDRYMYPEQRKVQEIFVQDAELANAIARRGRSGEDFDALASTYNARRLTKSRNGHLGYLAAHQQGKIGREAAQLQIGEISDPIEQKLGFSVIRVLDITPARQKTFKQAWREIKQDMDNDIAAADRQAWLERLKANTEITIFEDNLSMAFSDLPKLQNDAGPDGSDGRALIQ